MRAPWLTQGYLKDHANSERLWEGGWMHTQDIASRNAAGSLRITDRAKDIIKIGGEWLSSLELEDILSSHPAVADSAVIGRPDDKWGEIPLGLVVVKQNHKVTEKELSAHVRSYTAGVLPREAFLTMMRFVDADRQHQGRQDQQGGAAGKIPRVGPGPEAPATRGARARARRRAARRTGRRR